MRPVVFLLVIAVTVGAFLLLRTPAGDSAGVSPGAGSTASTPTRPTPLDLERGNAPASRTQVATDAPAAAATKPRPSKTSTTEPVAPTQPVTIVGLEALPAAAENVDDGLSQKYDGTTPETRRQAIESIRQELESNPNLESKMVGLLKYEVEWLGRSLDR